MRAIDPTNTNGNGRGNGRVPHDGTARKSSKWPLLVVALLGGHVLVLVAVVVVATRDPSFAVTPDYYENAIRWDESQAAKRASERLGWRIEIIAADEADPAGGRAVTIALTDASGAPVANAKIDITCFHHAHATRPTRLSATTAADGRATQVMSLRHAGFWDFQCKAVASDGQTFSATLTQFVNPPVRIAAATTTEQGAAR